MLHPDNIFQNILSLATSDDQIRGVVMVGSRANNPDADNLADFDIQLYSDDHSAYLENDTWLSTIAPVWICIALSYEDNDDNIPTRLVIFEDGIKVDFAFYPLHLLSDVQSRWQSCQILLDKDNVVNPDIVFVPAEIYPPTPDEFFAIVNNFWFEAYHVAKYLKRGDLWLVKFRDWATKEFLLPMLEWYAQSQHGWDYDTGYMGKHMPKWLDSNTWNSLHNTFAHFDADDSWSALLATTSLFSRLAQETAALLGITYPHDLEHNMMIFINRLRGE